MSNIKPHTWGNDLLRKAVPTGIFSKEKTKKPKASSLESRRRKGRNPEATLPSSRDSTSTTNTYGEYSENLEEGHHISAVRRSHEELGGSRPPTEADSTEILGSESLHKRESSSEEPLNAQSEQHVEPEARSTRDSQIFNSSIHSDPSSHTTANAVATDNQRRLALADIQQHDSEHIKQFGSPHNDEGDEGFEDENSERFTAVKPGSNNLYTVQMLLVQLKAKVDEIEALEEKISQNAHVLEDANEDAVQRSEELGKLRKDNVANTTKTRRLEEDIGKKANEIRVLKRRVRDLESGITELNKVIGTKSSEIEFLKNTNSALAAKQLQLERDQETALYRAEEKRKREAYNNVAEIEKLRKFSTDLHREHKFNIQRLEKSNAKALDDAREEHQKTLDQWREQFQNGIAKKNLEHQEKEQSLRDFHIAEQKKAAAEYEKKERKVHQEMESMKTQMKEDALQKDISHASAIKNLEEAAKTEKKSQSDAYQKMLADQKAREEELGRRHKGDTQYLRHQVQELNAALLAHDDESYLGQIFTTSSLPQKPDYKLKESFSAIQHIVTEQIGRRKWKEGATAWTDSLVQRLGDPERQRLVKKVILQDLTWVLLYHHLFASPFRMFGEVGQEFEKQWIKHSKQDKLDGWPAPSPQAERWRYLTVHQCQEALRQAVSSVDPRAQVKRGYMEHVTKVTNEAERMLGAFVEVNEDLTKLIKQLITQAVKVWLDFQMHRARIVMRLTGSGTIDPAQRAAAIKKGDAILTVAPELCRHGNMKGGNLETFTIISGCAGETFDFQGDSTP